MRAFLEVIWPRLGMTAALQEEASAALDGDLAAIAAADWSKLNGSVDHARQLTEAEADRKRTADTKASIYLAVIAALVPLVGSMVATDFRDEGAPAAGSAFAAVTALLFAVAMSYLIATGIWAFRVLKVSTYARMDVSELLSAVSAKTPEAEITKALLQAVRISRDGVNEKTSRIRMAHEFMVRTFLAFSALLLTVALWDIFAQLIGWLAATTCKSFGSPFG